MITRDMAECTARELASRFLLNDFPVNFLLLKAMVFA